jgi:hypothetical protein
MLTAGYPAPGPPAMRPTIYPESLAMIVADYRRGDAVREREAAWWCAEGHPFSEVVDRAGRARTEAGTRHSHQCRLTRAAIDGCVAALTRIAPQLETAKDYFAVQMLVKDAFEPVRGAGELAVYDTADRICERLGFSSQYIVYLHNGARVGYRRILGGRIPNESAWAIHYWQLPEGLRSLSNREAEDVLCIYKDDFLLTPTQLTAKWEGRRFNRCAPEVEHRPRC